MEQIIRIYLEEKQEKAVKEYLNETFTPQEVKIPDTELWIKLWIEKEQEGRYTWSLTDKDTFFFSH